MRPNKFICIHGHFYQPPRENAWLEAIEKQDSAAPFHDWNERVNFECYAPNATARILDDEQYIIKIQNNYTRMSFNFGPTLLSWMQSADPETYRAILEADRISRKRYGGHGSALAQVHSHVIMPLANRRDKETQVYWGVRDFAFRFGRRPEGMWLAETAVDIETLEVLAAQGVKFTILAPRQAKAVRPVGSEDWQPVNDGTLDSRRPYWCKLPSGRRIALFFYHGSNSQAVAFEGLLNNGKAFAHRLAGSLDENDEPQLVHIATDGESYGHHHNRGEMALADCLNYIEDEGLSQLTNYGQYLELFPPTYEAQIHENSSWSCVHGVERWRSNCGCNSGGNPGWTQAWRGPLRETLNWLRDQLAPIYEREAGVFLKDVWQARNEFIHILLNRTDEEVDRFLDKHARRALEKDEKTQLLRLLEMQRNAMLMFTSCGWFFDEISGIETNQILQYANRAIYYAMQVSGVDLHPEFLERLAQAPSNLHENGAVSYRKYVMPARLDLARVGMHFAASSLFEDYPQEIELFNYLAESEFYKIFRAGKHKLAVGRTIVRSRITYSEKLFSFCVIYLGQADIIGNISVDMDERTFGEMYEKIEDAFNRNDLGEVIGVMQTYFGSEKYGISNLFLDEKRKILDQITEQSMQQMEVSLRSIYNENYQLMKSVAHNDIPVPEAYLSAAEFVVNHDLHQLFSNGQALNIQELEHLVEELNRWNLELIDRQSFNLAASERIFRKVRDLSKGREPLRELEELITLMRVLQTMKLEPDVWKSQNLYFSLLRALHNGDLRLSPAEEKAFRRLGEQLRVRSQKAA